MDTDFVGGFCFATCVLFLIVIIILFCATVASTFVIATSWFVFVITMVELEFECFGKCPRIHLVVIVDVSTPFQKHFENSVIHDLSPCVWEHGNLPWSVLCVTVSESSLLR